MYNYQEKRNEIFTERGVDQLLKVRDKVKSIPETQSVFLMQDVCDCSWAGMALVDFLVERREIVEINKADCGQHRTFMRAK